MAASVFAFYIPPSLLAHYHPISCGLSSRKARWGYQRYASDSGMPVMCHGLTHPQEHLNGKIGDITSFAIGDIAVKMNASGHKPGGA